MRGEKKLAELVSEALGSFSKMWEHIGHIETYVTVNMLLSIYQRALALKILMSELDGKIPEEFKREFDNFLVDLRKLMNDHIKLLKGEQLEIDLNAHLGDKLEQNNHGCQT